MSDSVRSPSVIQCCTAAAGLVRGLVRPKRPDQRFIASIADAGLPDPDSTVTVTAVPQVPRSVPTAAIVESTFAPPASRTAESFVIGIHKPRSSSIPRCA